MALEVQRLYLRPDPDTRGSKRIIITLETLAREEPRPSINSDPARSGFNIGFWIRKDLPPLKPKYLTAWHGSLHSQRHQEQ